MYGATIYVALVHGETVTDLIDAAHEREAFNREQQRLHMQHIMYLRNLKMQMKEMAQYAGDVNYHVTQVEHPLMKEAIYYDMYHELEYTPERQRRQYMEIIEAHLRKHQEVRKQQGGDEKF